MMKFKPAAVATCILGLSVGALAMPPVASADERSYLSDLYQHTTLNHQDQILLNWGHASCNDFARGIPADQISHNIFDAAAKQGGYLTYDDASWIVRDAGLFLC